MIMSICDVPDVLKVFRIVNIVILIIKIAIPIALIISIMIDLAKNVVSAEDLSKTGNLITKKIIAAVIIFLIPTFVSIIFNAIGAQTAYKPCLEAATSSNIEAKYDKHMTLLMKEARKNPTAENYSAANSYLSNIKDEELRKEYKKELDEIKEKIDKKSKEAQSDSNPDVNPSPSVGENTSLIATAKKVWLEIVTGSREFTYNVGNHVPPTGTGVDCSTYIDWVLYEYGYKDFGGKQLHTDKLYSINWNKKYGWTELNFPAHANLSDYVQPGDIVVRRGPEKGHVTFIIEKVSKNKFHVYDCGDGKFFKHGDHPNGVYISSFITSDYRPAKIIRVTPKN